MVAGQQIRAQIFCADGVGFRFLKRLALIVAINCHRERKPNNQREKRKCCSLYDAEIVTLALFEGMRTFAK
jgi:hypothetical protein